MVSSEEPKAVETARVAPDRLGVGHLAFPNLHEHDRTGAPFLGPEEFARAARTFFERPRELVWGGETAEQALERFDAAVWALLGARDEEVIVVVAHGTVIPPFVARYNGIEPYGLWQKLGLPSLCVLTVPGFEVQEVVYSLNADVSA